MTKAEEMVLKPVRDLGAAVVSDVCNYTGLSPDDASAAINSLRRKRYLRVARLEWVSQKNEYGDDVLVRVDCFWNLTPEGRKAAKKIPDIDELMCIPISNLKKWRNEIRLIDADKMATDELAAFTYAQAKTNNVANRDISNSRTTETAEPQPDGIQFRTVDDLGRICIPKDIRDKLGIKPGTECAVYSTDELTPDEIIVIRRNKNDKH